EVPRVATVVVILAIFGTGFIDRWQAARERSLTLTERLTEPRVLAGIRTDRQTHEAFKALFTAIDNFERHHRGTRIVSQDHCDGYSNCVPESLLWLSFDSGNTHRHPVYWPIPTLTTSIYPEYRELFRNDLIVNRPLVVDSWDGDFRES